MHDWQHRDMLLMLWWMVSWGISTQILTQASLSSWTANRRYLIPFNGIDSFILQELLAYTCHMRQGIIMHQEEPKTSCTSEGSDNGSKDLISVPNVGQGAIIYSVQVCASLHGYIHQDFSGPFQICHMSSEWTCSYLWKAQDASAEPAWRMVFRQVRTLAFCAFHR